MPSAITMSGWMIRSKGFCQLKGLIVAAADPETGALEADGTVNQTDYVNINQVANVRVLPLGTDNFGRDVLTELVSATRVSLQIGFVAGISRHLDRFDPGIAGGVYRRYAG